MGRAGTRGVTVLIDASGRELALGVTDDEASARAHYDALHAFFAGLRRAASRSSRPKAWRLRGCSALAVLSSLFGPWTAPAALRAPPRRSTRAATWRPAPPPSPSRRRPRPRRPERLHPHLAYPGLARPALHPAPRHRRRQLHARLGDGAHPRAGEHEVRVFNPDEPAAPIVHRVAVVRGQVTHFECAR